LIDVQEGLLDFESGLVQPSQSLSQLNNTFLNFGAFDSKCQLVQQDKRQTVISFNEDVFVQNREEAWVLLP
jgi:hypothetical protein